ncbi:MAG: hypothetical protein LBQ60_05125 [Bacteroidales bacterium]|jgi:hypothetical protein|nr:hypothetical protein [Bacteroidales bacterium]
MTGKRLETLRQIEYCPFISYVYLEGISPETINRFDDYSLTCQLGVRTDVDFTIDLK